MGDPLIDSLDGAHGRGDPWADAVVAEIGDRIWAINGMLRGVRHNGDPLPAAIPAALGAIVIPELPAFADRHRLRRAQRFAERHLFQITTALFCASLPASYASADGARILSSTGRMEGDIDRRVNATAQFVLDVLCPHSFERSGRARCAIGKVRLVHAAVRRALGTQGGVVPIDQEQMLGTLCLFSLVVLEALERLGVVVDPRDAEDYVHLWCVVGGMLGVDVERLPADVATARQLLAAIRRRRFAPSPEGRALMAQLLEGMERHMPASWLRPAPRYLIHHLLGEDVALGLGCPSPPRAWRRLAMLTTRASLPSSLAARLSDLTARPLLTAMTYVKLSGAPARFAMPTGGRA